MKKIIHYATSKMQSDKSGHGLDHIQRVELLSRKLAKKEGGSINKIAVMAWLHEALDYKFVEQKERAKREVLELISTKFSISECEEIIFDLENISFKGGHSKPLRTLEGKIVQDSDRLDSIGAIGIARAFYYAGHFGEEMHNPKKLPQKFESEESYLAYIKAVEGTTINHFYEKLLKVKTLMNSESGRALAIEKDAFLRQFLDNFISEWV
ncbi:MAG: HD domain-containing protein [Fusobacteria bacterium]|nr:HD domain-containing protein [Fusobacteriota bacterium]